MGVFSSGALRRPSYIWVHDLILDHPSHGALWASVCIDPTTKNDLLLLLLLPPPLFLLLLLLLLLLPGGVFSSGSFRVVLFIWAQDCVLDHPSHQTLWTSVCSDLTTETDVLLLLLLFLLLPPPLSLLLLLPGVRFSSGAFCGPPFVWVQGL